LMCRPPNSVIGCRRMAIARHFSSSPAGPKAGEVWTQSADRKTSCKICLSTVRSGPARSFKRSRIRPFGVDQTNLHLLHDVIEPAHEALGAALEAATEA